MDEYRLNLPDDDDGSDDYEVELPDVVFDPSGSDEDDDEPLPLNLNEEWERNYAEQTQWDYRFSIKELMAVTAFAAVVLTVLKFFSASLAVMALVLGMAVGVGVVLMHYGTGFGALFYLCWWMLLAMYLIVSMVAMLRE